MSKFLPTTTQNIPLKSETKYLRGGGSVELVKSTMNNEPGLVDKIYENLRGEIDPNMQGMSLEEALSYYFKKNSTQRSGSKEKNAGDDSRADDVLIVCGAIATGLACFIICGCCLTLDCEEDRTTRNQTRVVPRAPVNNEESPYRPNEEARDFVKSFARDMLECVLPAGDLSKEERDVLLLINEQKAVTIFNELSNLKGDENFDQIFSEILYPRMDLEVGDDVKEEIKIFFESLHSEVNKTKLNRGNGYGYNMKNFIYDKILKDNSSQSHQIIPERLKEFIDIFSGEIRDGLVRIHAMVHENRKMAEEDKSPNSSTDVREFEAVKDDQKYENPGVKIS